MGEGGPPGADRRFRQHRAGSGEADVGGFDRPSAAVPPWQRDRAVPATWQIPPGSPAAPDPAAAAAATTTSTATVTVTVTVATATAAAAAPTAASIVTAHPVRFSPVLVWRLVARPAAQMVARLAATPVRAGLFVPVRRAGSRGWWNTRTGLRLRRYTCTHSTADNPSPRGGGHRRQLLGTLAPLPAAKQQKEEKTRKTTAASSPPCAWLRPA